MFSSVQTPENIENMAESVCPSTSTSDRSQESYILLIGLLQILLKYLSMKPCINSFDLRAEIL